MQLKQLTILMCLIVVVSGGCISSGTPTSSGRESSDVSRKPYKYDVYYVQAGDTLHSIGRREGIHWSRIAHVNKCNPRDLSVGDTLLLPRYKGEPGKYEVPQAPEPSSSHESAVYSGYTVVVDAGHGGKDPGAISPIGVQEKQINLPVAKRVARGLRECGMNVKLVRRDDSFVKLNERADIANRMGADMFVSIHADSADNASARGFSVYIKREAPAITRALAGAVIRGMSKTDMQNRGVREADFRVLVRTECPAILVELGFLSNRAEAKMLRKAKIQKMMAGDIVWGIKNFVKSRADIN